MKVMIVGGCGYVGSRLTELLISLSLEVDVVDTCWFGNNISHLKAPVDVNDIIDYLVEDFESYDVVIYLGGLSNDPMAEFSPTLNYIHNTSYPIICAEKAKKAGVKKFIFASSCSVYGSGTLCTEKSGLHTNYPYGISKAMAETGLRLLQDDNFKVIILRKGTVGGHSPRMRFDLIINKMFKDVTQGGVITVNSPMIKRPLLDIRDAIKAYANAIFYDHISGGTYNIISENVNVLDVATRIQAWFADKFDVKVHINNTFDLRDYSVDGRKAQDIFGYHSTFRLEDTLDEMVQHYTESKYDFSDPNTINIEIFKDLDL